MPGRAGGPPSDEQLLTVDCRVESGAVVVSAVGEVDTFTAPRLRAVLDAALRSAAARRVVVDLLGVSFLGSAGLTVLVEAAEHARERHEPLRVVVDHHRPVLRPLQVGDLTDALQLRSTLSEALTS